MQEKEEIPWKRLLASSRTFFLEIGSMCYTYNDRDRDRDGSSRGADDGTKWNVGFTYLGQTVDSRIA